MGYIVDKQHWTKLRRILKTQTQRREKIAELEKKARTLKKEMRALTPKAKKQK